VEESIMTVEEVKKIIDEESLKGGNLFEKRENYFLIDIREQLYYNELTYGCK